MDLYLRARRRRGELLKDAPKQDGGDARRKTTRSQFVTEQIPPTLHEQGVGGGELLIDAPKAPGKRTDLNLIAKLDKVENKTLKEQGVDFRDASKDYKLLEIPDERWETYILTRLGYPTIMSQNKTLSPVSLPTGTTGHFQFLTL